MGMARTPDALVLAVELCNQLAGCPGCGVIAQGHGRVVVEVIDAPWAGVPVRIRWFKGSSELSVGGASRPPAMRSIRSL